MNPDFVAASDWGALSSLISNLWVFVFSVAVFAFSLLLGHAIIPSLVATGHLPGGAERIRPFLYILSLAALAGAYLFARDALVLSRVILDIYPRLLI